MVALLSCELHRWIEAPADQVDAVSRFSNIGRDLLEGLLAAYVEAQVVVMKDRRLFIFANFLQEPLCAAYGRACGLAQWNYRGVLGVVMGGHGFYSSSLRCR
ncbi:hypothetical protein D9M72_433220 [compost metagenome]